MVSRRQKRNLHKAKKKLLVLWWRWANVPHLITKTDKANISCYLLSINSDIRMILFLLLTVCHTHTLRCSNICKNLTMFKNYSLWDPSAGWIFRLWRWQTKLWQNRTKLWWWWLEGCIQVNQMVLTWWRVFCQLWMKGLPFLDSSEISTYSTLYQCWILME